MTDTKTIRDALGNAHSHETAEGKQFWITAALVALDRIEEQTDDEVREAEKEYWFSAFCGSWCESDDEGNEIYKFSKKEEEKFIEIIRAATAPKKE